MSFLSRLTASLAAGACLFGCGDPAAPDIPDLTDGSLHLFGVLVADSSYQVVYVDQTDGLPITRLDAVLSEVGPDGGLTTVATAAPVEGQGTSYAMVFEARVEPGRRYRVTVTAPGRPTATASTTVPSDFEITALDARGDPPGSTGLTAVWSPSAGAFRYIVNVRASPDCLTNPPICEGFGSPWAGVTGEARIDTIVPAAAIPADRTRAVEVAVIAVNRELFEYFTTGVGGPFTVQPKQNVHGGHGVLGAWVRRIRTVDRSTQGPAGLGSAMAVDQRLLRSN